MIMAQVLSNILFVSWLLRKLRKNIIRSRWILKFFKDPKVLILYNYMYDYIKMNLI